MIPLTSEIQNILYNAQIQIEELTGASVKVNFVYSQDTIQGLPDKIIRVVSDVLGIPVEEILSKQRRRNICEAKVIIVQILSEKCPYFTMKQMAQIVGYMGKKGIPDHASVSHCKVIFSNLMVYDYYFREKWRLVQIELNRNHYFTPNQQSDNQINTQVLLSNSNATVIA